MEKETYSYIKFLKCKGNMSIEFELDNLTSGELSSAEIADDVILREKIEKYLDAIFEDILDEVFASINDNDMINEEFEKCSVKNIKVKISELEKG